jgi:hypothetical protein
MQLSALIIAASLSLLTSANPIALDTRTSSPSCKKADQLATFQDLTAVPALSQISPVGTYKGINYRSFNVIGKLPSFALHNPIKTNDLCPAEVGVLGALPPPVGLIPPSPYKLAANSITGTLLTGSPAFLASGIKSFDLYSTYIACTANTAISILGVPTQCTIAFTAFKKDSTVAFETINAQFNPTGLQSTLIQVVFPSSWTGLTQVDIAIVEATATSALTAFFIDDVKYKTCT